MCAAKKSSNVRAVSRSACQKLHDAMAPTSALTVKMKRTVSALEMTSSVIMANVCLNNGFAMAHEIASTAQMRVKFSAKIVRPHRGTQLTLPHALMDIVVKMGIAWICTWFVMEYKTVMMAQMKGVSVKRRAVQKTILAHKNV